MVRRRMGGVLVAALLAVVLGASPPAVQTALAAGPLRLQADTTYTLDPDAGAVHVEIDVRVTSLKPNTASFIYFYREVAFALQPEASRIRATDGNGAISITTRKREFFIKATVRLRANLYYQDSTRFTIRYDLVGGDPRSESPTRVGKAFATFGVWAWGDVGRSTVEVYVPNGFESRFDGDPMKTTTTATTGQYLTASPADPSTFYAIITSENADAYGETRISLAGGVEIIVRAWPEDGRWSETATETLREGMPELRTLIGLDWPVERDLEVLERYTPALEGYAGVFLTDEQRIEVSEDLDPVVIMHEASHAWFNEDLFNERWIYEGLAEEYAWRVQTAVGGDAGLAPSRPDDDDPGFVALATWTHPRVIRDQETDDREQYGYQAAFWVMHQIVEAAGVDAMREAFANADANLTAYPGAGPRETVNAVDTWRRLLDLAEPLDAPASATVDAAMRAFVKASTDEELDSRAVAREVYRDLLEAGDGWLAPWYVRRLLGEWHFDDATERMAEATTVLGLRDQVATAADALDLEPDDTLETAYEHAELTLGGATAIANDQLSALAAVADARVKVDTTPDLVSQIGLLGETPRAPYEAARAAFEAGELDDALAQAAAAAALITGAAAIGQQRLIVGVATTVLVLLFLVLLVALLRRRGRRRALALAARPEAYATLAADPATAPVPAPPPPSAGSPDDEGGPARGDSPAGP